MTKDQIKEILERVLTWPEDQQENAANVLLGMEERDTPYTLSPEDRASIKRGLEQARRGEFVPDEEVKAFFDRHR
ncbi:MAG TPA: hypothetical protein VGT78_09610 [Rhizomicrobium sp.]|nr:hypothetical protein [Rhizomicrobium sp.]